MPGKQRMGEVLKFLQQFPPSYSFKVTGEDVAVVYNTSGEYVGDIDFYNLVFHAAYGKLIYRQGEKITKVE